MGTEVTQRGKGVDRSILGLFPVILDLKEPQRSLISTASPREEEPGVQRERELLEVTLRDGCKARNNI